MPYTSPYFSNTTGFAGEVSLVDDLVREQIKLFGVDLLYMPRKMLNLDKLLHESSKSAFEMAMSIPMYIKTFDGYDQGMELLTKFGVRNADELTLTCSRSEFETYYAPALKDYYESINGGKPLNELEGQTATRPKEGDLIYFPFDDGIFEIKYVQFDNPFFQFGRGYIFEMRCEKFEYSGETFTTGYDRVDDVLGAEDTYYTLEFLVKEGGVGSFRQQEIVTIGPVNNALQGDVTESRPLAAEDEDIITTETELDIYTDVASPDISTPIIMTERGEIIMSNSKDSDNLRMYNDSGFIEQAAQITATVVSWDSVNRKLKLSLLSNEDPLQKNPTTGDIDVDKLENSVIAGQTSKASWYVESGVSLASDKFNDDDVIQDEFDQIKIVDPADTNPFGFI